MAGRVIVPRSPTAAGSHADPQKFLSVPAPLRTDPPEPTPKWQRLELDLWHPAPAVAWWELPGVEPGRDAVAEGAPISDAPHGVIVRSGRSLSARQCGIAGELARPPRM